jgi:hypothetical protein
VDDPAVDLEVGLIGVADVEPAAGLVERANVALAEVGEGDDQPEAGRLALEELEGDGHHLRRRMLPAGCQGDAVSSQTSVGGRPNCEARWRFAPTPKITQPTNRSPSQTPTRTSLLLGMERE